MVNWIPGLLLLASTTLGAPTSSEVIRDTAAIAAAPTVKLDNGVFTGKVTNGVNAFLGIPFAQPPVGNLRFKLPVANSPYNGSYTATSYGPSCFQQNIDLPLPAGVGADAVNYLVNTIYGAVFSDAEDCLTVNVFVPPGTTASSKLPVVAWIFGGGFELGSPAMYDGSGTVSRSTDLVKGGIIFVSLNYRVSGLGFMPGKEVKAAGVGNLGLQDQRQALRWINKYITAFGGDPTKVTLWGESAGAISASLQMIANGGNTEGLFRGSFMQSGSPIPVDDITKGQPYYDAVVAATGCSSATDTLACLRTVPYAKLTAAINQSPGIFSYQSLVLAWLPRVDGVFLKEAPYAAVQGGRIASVPIVTGDCDDEGTLFSISQLNVTTDAEFQAYVRGQYLPGATASEIAALVSAYPNSITAGSPFDSGIFNALTPQFKRLAAFQGDLVFQAPRRWLLQHFAGTKAKAWAFLYKRGKALPFFGTAHATDILNSFGGGELQDYVIAFTATLDPNNAGISPSWPTWSNSNPQMLALVDGLIPRTLVSDTYRADQMTLLNKLALLYPL